MTTQIQAEMKRIRELLPTEAFEDSKDWREGNTVERIEWLLTMYESAELEIERLQADLDNMNRYFGEVE
jgi:ATP-dependent protease HslVU (ClpYQ) peptidase subunit